MADDDEVVVTIDDQTDPTAKGDDVKVVEKPIVDPAVNDLAKQYKELEARETAAREAKAASDIRAAESERLAHAAIQEAEEAKKQVRGANLDTINTAHASASAEIEAAKRDIRLAGEAGDYEAQTAAIERLTGAKALLLRYDEAKADIETATAQSKRAPQQDRRSTDPVEAYVAGRAEPTKQWLRAHPDFVTDKRKNAKLNAAHHDAMGEGLDPDTNDYFKHVEKFLGLEEPGKPNGVKRPAARTVAPTATASGSAPSNSNEVRLTQGEARAATDGTHVWNYDDPSGNKRFKKGDPIGLQEMARRKQAMAKQGAYDRTYEVQ